MSVKLGFNHHNDKVAISAITVEDLDIIEQEVKVLEDIVTSRSKQLDDHVSMLDSVRGSIALMEEQEMKQNAEKERLKIERAKLLEEQATSLSNKITDINAIVATQEDVLATQVGIQLELKLDSDDDFANWYNANTDYFEEQTIYTQANILQSNLAEVITKQQASIILEKVLALDESTKVLLDLIPSESITDNAIEMLYEELHRLKEEALSYGLYSANQPGEIVKRLSQVEEALWKLEQLEVKEDIEALVFSMESEESVDKDKISSFREEIKQLGNDAKEYNLYQDLLYAWQVLDSIKPKELQEEEDARHTRILAKKQEQLALEEEHKATSIMSHAFNEAQNNQEKQ